MRPFAVDFEVGRQVAREVEAVAAAAAAVFVGAAIVTAPEPQQISPPQLSAVYGAVSSNEPGFTAVKVAVASNAVIDGAR